METGMTKFDLAYKIAKDLNLANICKEKAGYNTNNQLNLPDTDNLETADKALELYLERLKKILETIKVFE